MQATGLARGRRTHSWTGSDLGVDHIRGEFCMEHCRVIDAWCWVRQGILGPGWIGRKAWSSKAATGIVPLHLHNQLDERRDGPVVRLSYDLQDIRDQMYYEIRLQTAHLKRGGFRWWFLCPMVTNGRPCGRRAQRPSASLRWCPAPEAFSRSVSATTRCGLERRYRPARGAPSVPRVIILPGLSTLGHTEDLHRFRLQTNSSGLASGVPQRSDNSNARTELRRMNRWRAEIPMTSPLPPQVSFSLSSACPAAVVAFVNCRCQPCSPQGIGGTPHRASCGRSISQSR